MMEQAFDYIEMKIPAKPEYVGVIRLTLSGIASRMGFTYELIEDLKIAMSEAVTNAVQHGYKEEGGEVIVGFAQYEDRLELMVADQGKPFDFQKARKENGPYDEDTSVESLREGGLGLYLIESLMDEVRYHQNDGVTVFMAKHLEREQVENSGQTIKS